MLLHRALLIALLLTPFGWAARIEADSPTLTATKPHSIAISAESVGASLSVASGDSVELISVAVNIPAAGSVVVAEFVGQFRMPLIPLRLSFDCSVDGDPAIDHGCTISTVIADFDFTSLAGVVSPAGADGSAGALVPASFLIHGLSRGTHVIGIRAEASVECSASDPSCPPDYHVGFIGYPSSLIATVYRVH